METQRIQISHIVGIERGIISMARNTSATDELTIANEWPHHDMPVIHAWTNRFPYSRRQNHFVMDSRMTVNQIAQNRIMV